VAVVDDHPALHAGVAAILATEPEMRLVGTAGGEEDLWPLLRRAAPDVLLLGTTDPPAAALHVCLSVAGQLDGPRVVLYGTAGEDAGATVAASLAGASAIVARTAPAVRLLGTIRAVARVPQSVLPVPLKMKRAAAALLDPADHAILAMRLAGEPAEAIADTLGVPARTVWDRLLEMVDRLEAVQVAA
jgi:DNA-binding NarL/FixJ family response regulator